MDIEAIKRLALAHGCSSAYLSKYEKHSGKAITTDRVGHYVHVKKDGMCRSIGKFELEVSKLSEAQIVERIETRFARS